MSFELIIPDIEKKGSCKDFIISVLINNWPLTLKEIFNGVKKKYKFGGTYQSVFKAVNELLKKHVLVKKGNKYEINISWIKKLQSFTDIVETNYYAEKKTEDFGSKKGEDIVILNFSCVFDAEKYLYYFVKNELKKLKNEEVFYELDNLWKVLFYYRAEFNYYTKLMKLGHKFYFLFCGESEIEKKAASFYKKIGVNIRKKKGESSTDIIIFGDYYIQIFIPENVKKKIINFLNNGLDYELLKILDEKNDAVKLIVHKDKNLTNGLKIKLREKF
jgi:hypothetical protein